MSKPRVLITLGSGTSVRREARFPTVEQKMAYGDAVARAGGVPIWVAPSPVDVVSELIEVADALVVTGGDFDIPPELYGETRRVQRIDAEMPERTAFESALLRAALAAQLPILAVCGGMQLLAALEGGRLHQDIAEEIPEALLHEQPSSPREAHHVVHLAAGSPVAERLGRDTVEVNSTHHQAVAHPGLLEVYGRASDGVIECIGRDEGRVLGVQWHPELLDDDVSRDLYRALIRFARPG